MHSQILRLLPSIKDHPERKITIRLSVGQNVLIESVIAVVKYNLLNVLVQLDHTFCDDFSIKKERDHESE